jgi:2-haloacid dehalogenase
MFNKEKEKKEYFFKYICTPEWHARQDAGRPVKEATEELVKIHPDWEHPIRTFYGRWKEMFQGPIEGSVRILKELKDKGYKLYALTNWSAELFQLSLEDFEFLHWFDGRVVSGEEKINKPDLSIYKILLDRYKINPGSALFIDDKKENVRAAGELGIEGIQFESPEQLREELINRQVL